MNEWKMNIFATHEEDQTLAKNRPWPGDWFPGVALPCVKAMDRWIQVRYQDKTTFALVWDVGPWFIDDDPYVLGITRPIAELYRGKPVDSDRKTPGIQPATVQGKVVLSNGAGIDLFPFTAKLLGIPINKNVMVDWRFAEL